MDKVWQKFQEGKPDIIRRTQKAGSAEADPAF